MTGKKIKTLVCSSCSKEYSSQIWFEKHKCNLLKTGTKIKKSKIKKIISKNNTCIPEFEFSDDLFFSNSSKASQIIPSGIDTHLDKLKKFSNSNDGELKILHLNINSIFNKIDSIHDILDLGTFDIIFINESKLDNTVPDSHLSHIRYTLHRRDRKFLNDAELGRHGGGLLIFIRKFYIHSIEICDKFEAMHLSVTHNNTTAHFIVCYKSPSLVSNNVFLEFLDLKVSDINPDDPLFIIGDLNMDLNSFHGNLLQDFMADFVLTNFVKESTRVASRLSRKNSSSKFSESSTLLDVILHNDILITETLVVGCPFSDHKFVAASVSLDKPEPYDPVIWSRSLSDENLTSIGNKLSSLDFTKMDKFNNCNDKWLFLKNSLLIAIDKISPLKKIKIKQENKCPWFDLELVKSKTRRDALYSIFSDSRLDHDWENYKDARKNFQSLNRAKIIAYFDNKGPRDFKNSKKFWTFYKSWVKLRSDKTGSDGPNQIMHDSEMVSDPVKIVDLFNSYFTSIESVSLSNQDASVKFIENHFNSLKKIKLLSLMPMALILPGSANLK